MKDSQARIVQTSCFLSRATRSETDSLAVDVDHGLKHVSLGANANETSLVPVLLVPSVPAIADNPQIASPVVQPVAIDVVYLELTRRLSGNEMMEEYVRLRRRADRRYSVAVAVDVPIEQADRISHFGID